MTENIDGVIEFKDINLVGCLAVLGFPILTVDSKEYPHCNFLFKKTKELINVVKNFYDGTLLIEPNNLMAKIREIKSRIESSRKLK